MLILPSLSALTPAQRSDAKHWLWLAVFSLALSGLAPLLLLAGRASVYAEFALVKQWFVPVLVIHVNLSVGLWFLALAMMVLRLLLPNSGHPRLANLARLSFLAGVLAIVLAPLAGGEAYTSNYIPVQDNAVFFGGLLAVLLSVVLNMIISVIPNSALAMEESQEGRGLRFLLTAFVRNDANTIMITLFTALLCFGLSIAQHPAGYSGEPYYEAVFWGGGHVLQFVYVQIAVVGWLYLAQSLSIPLPSRRVFGGFWGLFALAALVSPAVYVLFDINSYYHLKFFSWQMNIFTGTLPALLLGWLLWHGRRAQRAEHPAGYNALLMSILLFLSGGLVGFLIEGSNTIIPAHYHGSTVGVTLALMGLVYLLLPHLGYASVANWRSARWQSVLYGSGQLLHVVGFALAGTQGAGRKVAGAMEGATPLAEAGMQLVRLGGLLAVIGGGLFVVVVIRAMRKKHLEPSANKA